MPIHYLLHALNSKRIQEQTLVGLRSPLALASIESLVVSPLLVCIEVSHPLAKQPFTLLLGVENCRLFFG